MTIHIVQPALPGYRNDFFAKLQSKLSKLDETIRVYASVQDHFGVVSVAPSGFDCRLDSRIRSILDGKMLWQAGLDIKLIHGDVLVIDGNPRWLNNYVLLLRAKLRRIPVLWWGQGWSAGSYGHRSRTRQRIMRLADAVILYTDKERSKYLEMGFRPERIFALNNGLNVDHIESVITEWNAPRLREFQKANGLSECAHWCIFVGRLTRKSDIVFLIESLIRIGRNTGLIVIGDGAIGEEAKAKAQSLGLGHRVIWTGAKFDEHAIAPWMLSASVFVYPGAVGLSLIHGFAYGLPAVIHNDERRQMPEYAAFENGRNGLAYERGSAQSLVDAINALILDHKRRQSMGMRAAALVRKTFNVNDMADRFLAAIGVVRRKASVLGR